MFYNVVQSALETISSVMALLAAINVLDTISSLMAIFAVVNVLCTWYGTGGTVGHFLQQEWQIRANIQLRWWLQRKVERQVRRIPKYEPVRVMIQ